MSAQVSNNRQDTLTALHDQIVFVSQISPVGVGWFGPINPMSNTGRVAQPIEQRMFFWFFVA